MNESEYWQRLEFRVCREFAGLRDDRFRGLGCDGFNPEHLHSDGDGTRITGTAWLMNGRGQEPWRFTLLAGDRVRSWEDADWSALLPPDDVTGWLSVDREQKTLQIDPAAAHPDTGPAHRDLGGTTS